MHHPSHRSLSALSLLGALALTACGSTSHDHGSNGNGAGTGGGAGSASDAGSPDGAAQGGCGLHTQFAGDSQCIPAPDPEKGFQLHIGPDSYDNLSSDWLVQPGDENVVCYHLKTPNTQAVYYFEQHYRMRPGSHHMIITTSSTTSPDGWGPCTNSIINSIGGTQHITEDVPPNGQIAPEDEGLAHSIGPNTQLEFQLHFFNTTDSPTLREAWVNFIYKDPSTVTNHLGMLGAFTAVDVPPHSSAVVSGQCDESQAIGAPTDPRGVRIVELFGHAHWHNQRFVVYRDKTDGTSEVVYDSYDGAEAPSYMYNSIIQNPVPDPVNRHSGAASGDFWLAPGEKMHFDCDITNDLNTPLLGTNEAFTGEMCILFGSVVGAGFPCFDLGQKKTM
jgi:hypothetical protein